MKIVIGQDPYPGNKDEYQAYTISLDCLASLSSGHEKSCGRINYLSVLGIEKCEGEYKIDGNSVSEVVVAFLPLFKKAMNPENVATLRRVLSLVYPENKVRIILRDFYSDIQEEDYDKASRKVFDQLNNDGMLFLNIKDSEGKVNPYISHVFKYYKEHGIKLILLGDKAIGYWNDWKKNIGCAKNPLTFIHPSSRIPDAAWVKIDKLKEWKYSDLESLARFKDGKRLRRRKKFKKVIIQLIHKKRESQ